MLIVSAFVLSLSVAAQNTNDKKELQIKLGYSRYELRTYFEENISVTPINAISLDVCKELSKYIDLGGYLGCGFFNERSYDFETPNTVIGLDFKNSRAFSFGGRANLHCLPLFIKKSHLRFDIYMATKLGADYYFTNKGDNVAPESGMFFNYGVYAGAAYYLGQHWGAFFEYGFSNTYNMRYGLALKF